MKNKPILIDNVRLLPYINNPNLDKEKLKSHNILQAKVRFPENMYFWDNKILELENYNLAKLNLSGYEFIRVTFKNCIFYNMNFDNAYFENCEFINCIFENCSAKTVQFYQTDFKSCEFKAENDWSSKDKENPTRFNIVRFLDCNITNLSLKNILVSIIEIINVVKKNTFINISDSLIDNFTIKNSCLDESNIINNNISNLYTDNVNFKNFKNNYIYKGTIADTNLEKEVESNIFGNKALVNLLVPIDSVNLERNQIHEKVIENNEFHNIKINHKLATEQERRIFTAQSPSHINIFKQINSFIKKIYDNIVQVKKTYIIIFGLTILGFGLTAFSLEGLIFSFTATYLALFKIKPLIIPYCESLIDYCKTYFGKEKETKNCVIEEAKKIEEVNDIQEKLNKAIKVKMVQDKKDQIDISMNKS